MHQNEIDRRALLDRKTLLGADGRPGLLPVRNTTFYAMIASGKFPPPRKIGRRSVWIASEVFAALERLASEGR